MRSATLLVAMTLMVWGWQSRLPLTALLMAAPLLLSPYIHWRIELVDKDFHRVADLTSVLFFIFVVFQFSTKGASGIFSILAALAYLFYPLLVTQYFSRYETTPLSALFISMRKPSGHTGQHTGQRINLDYPYSLIVIISASAGNRHGVAFYICLGLLAIFSLWLIRPARYQAVLWGLMLSLAIGLGLIMQTGLKVVQSQFEQMIATLLNEAMWLNRDPHKTRTAFGYIGRLKLSDKIHVRVSAADQLKTPLLLREASYNHFGFGLWSSDNNAFQSVDPSLHNEWLFAPETTKPAKYTISSHFSGDKSVIPLPHGTYKISNVAATEAEINALGTVNLGMKPGWVRYDAYYTEALSDAPPNEHDLVVHRVYKPTLTKLAKELTLFSQTPTQAIATVAQYFQDNFTYSLDQHRRFKGKNRLEDFLYHRRQGHCEFFATVTTLLLRTVGIPTRYVVGYSVQEYSPLENQYVARARDAHSWTLAYVNDEWIVLDNTPVTWAQVVDENWWQTIADLWSWGSYLVSIWRDYGEERNQLIVKLLIVLLVIYLFWRLFTDPRFIKTVKTTGQHPLQFTGPESPAYKLMRHLQARGLSRGKAETLRLWLLRVGTQFDQMKLDAIIKIHYRCRFDPQFDHSDRTQRKNIEKSARYVEEILK